MTYQHCTPEHASGYYGINVASREAKCAPTSNPLLLKIGQRFGFAWNSTILMGGTGGLAAKCALSWQLSYHMAGQRSPAAHQTDGSPTPTLSFDEFYE